MASPYHAFSPGMKPPGWALALARFGADQVAPLRDLVDQTPVQSLGLTATAWSKIDFLEAPLCDGCGRPFEYDLGAGARCEACLARPRRISRLRAACFYDAHSRDLILQLKHADRPELGGFFARWLSRVGADLLAEADVIAPTPLHGARLFARRYNQAAEIARPLAHLWGLAYAPDILIRKRKTESQGGKSARGRARNVAGAFTVRKRHLSALKRQRVLLVDDVYTTGATMEACARVLLASGAASVDVLAVARVRDGRDLSI